MNNAAARVQAPRRSSWTAPRELTLPIAAIALSVALVYGAFVRGEERLLLAALLGSEVLALCVARPRLALTVFAAFWGVAHVLLSNSEGQAGGGTSVSQLVGITVILGFGIAVARSFADRDRPPVPLALRAFAAFAVLYAFAEILTPLQSAGRSDLIKLLGGLVLALAGYVAIDSESRLVTLARAVGVAGVLVALVAIAQFASGSTLGVASFAANGTEFRAAGLDGGATGTADFLLVAASFALLSYTVRLGRRRTRLDVGMLLTISLGLLATLTRADVLGLLALLSVWAVLWQVREVSAAATRVRLVAVVVLVGFAAVQSIGGSALTQRLEGNASESSESNLLNGRGAIWSNELSAYGSGNVLEALVGQGAHRSYTRVYIPQSFAYREFPPHNLALWLLVETGAIGLMTYGFALISLAGRFQRTARAARYTMSGRVAAVGLAATVAFTLDGMFHNVQLSTGSNWYFMLLVGVALRMSRATLAAPG